MSGPVGGEPGADGTPGGDGPLRVVLAEDEAIVRLDLREILVEEGYDVVAETGRGDEALALVRELRPDLAVLDIKMPGLDGLAAAREISGERLAAVLVLTAFSQRELVDEARDAGALAYVVKPFQRSELVPAIELAVARFAELRALEEANRELSDQARRLQDQLESRRVVERAKGLLMDERQMTEAEAFTYIQRNAMRLRLTMREVAGRIIEGAIDLPEDAGRREGG